MERNELIQLRVTPEEKDRIRQDAKSQGYTNISGYILDMVFGRIVLPEKKEDIKDQIRQALVEDPSILDESLKRIGLRFVSDK